jgi:hypothetical protein
MSIATLYQFGCGIWDAETTQAARLANRELRNPTDLRQLPESREPMKWEIRNTLLCLVAFLVFCA